MKVGFKVKGLEKLVGQLQQRVAKARRDDGAAASVGYTQSYALYVHEDLQARHPHGKARYLIDPARRLIQEVSDIVSRLLAAGRPMAQALLVGALRIQRESQREVPVDTGALKSSAFTRLG